RPPAGRASVTAFLSVDCHPVAADEPCLLRLRRLFAALADAAREALESRQLAQLERAVIGVRFQMDEAAIARSPYSLHSRVPWPAAARRRLRSGADSPPQLQASPYSARACV